MRGRTTSFALALLAFVVVGAAFAVPPGPPPKVSGTTVSPPPAWIEAGAAERWLAYSSYCWKTACVDFLPPEMRTGLPALTVRRGVVTELHFRFVPTKVTVSIGAGKPSRLPAARVVQWRPKGSGVAMIATEAAAGDASYLIRVRLR